MSAPRRKFNYNSPYAKNAGHYPSQTAEYMTQHAGGPQQQQQQQQQFDNGHQQNFGFYEDRQQSAPTPAPANVPHFYQNKQQQQQQPNGRNFNQPRQQRWQQRRGNGNGNERNVDTFSQYFHSSMLEDPWRDLIARHQAIHGNVPHEDELSDQDDAQP